MLILKIILVLIIFNIFYINKNVNNYQPKIDFIKKLIFNHTRSLNIFSCWNKENILEIWKNFNNNFQFVSILNDIDDGLFFESETFLLDTICPNSKAILEKAGKLWLFSGKYKWLIFDDKSLNLSNFNFLFDSNVYVVNDNFSIKRYHKIESESLMLYEDIGEYNIKNVIRKNYMYHLLNVSLVITNNKSLNHLTDYREKQIDTIAKANYQIVQFILDYINASRYFKTVNTWGYLINNTTNYTGMIGHLQKNEAEIGGTALFFTADRIAHIEYVAMISPTKAKFIFRQPPLSYVNNLFLLPFSKSVWFCAIAIVLITIILLYIVLNILPMLRKQSNLKNSISDIIMISVAAVCQQGLDLQLVGYSTKTIIISAFTSLMFTYTAYSANIVALLQSSAQSINTLEDLLESNAILAAADTPYNQHYFRIATEPIRRNIYIKKIAPIGEKEHFISVEEGIERVRKGFFAFHVELGVGYKLISETYQEHEKCGLETVEYLQVGNPYLSIKKNSSLKEIIRIGLRKIQENGLQNREVIRIYTNKPQCNNLGSNFVSVGLGDIYGAFYILSTGCLLASLVMLIEKMTLKFKKKIHPLKK